MVSIPRKLIGFEAIQILNCGAIFLLKFFKIIRHLIYDRQAYLRAKVIEQLRIRKKNIP